MTSRDNPIGLNLPIGSIVAVASGSAIAAAVVMSDMGIGGLLAPAILILLCLLLRFPELAFVLFINAGAYKADPRLDALQLPSVFDLTLFFEALCILGILIGVVSGRITIFRLPRKMVIPYIAIAGMSAFSLIYTGSPIYGTEKLLRFLVITSFSMWGPWFLFQDWQCIKRFFTGWVILSTAMVLDVLAGGLEPAEFIFRSAFGSSGYLGLGVTTAQAIIILLFGFFATTTNTVARLVVFSLISLSVFGMLVSGARTAPIVLPAIIMAVLVYAIIHLLGRVVLVAQLRRDDVLIIKAVAWLVVALMVAGVWGREYFVTFETRTQLLLERAEELESERLALVPAAAQALFTSPLLGLGIGGFSVYFYDFDSERGGYPHNIFLEIGSELGIIGLAGFALLCYWTVAVGMRTLQTVTGQPYTIGVTLLSLFSFMLLYYQFHGDVNDARLIFAWAGSVFAFGHLALRSNLYHAR